MLAEMESPASQPRGVPEVSLAAGKIDPEFTSLLAQLQASRLQRLHALTYATAITVARLAYGVAR
ncbi:hypothetical protein [Bradyrhizobium sp. BR 10289]|uniref:hypothetical protein n=1 Tax=Bradyrhizobium sp. BR 10289 TaxID=2749993 RepID=UPI001C6462D6|nr:hypothetical protein [Bradyrhizobium sp. BR 10289]MBW7968616.1 hypothetical protein [Bradyrhizobium sp. BR 10289]